MQKKSLFVVNKNKTTKIIGIHAVNQDFIFMLIYLMYDKDKCYKMSISLNPYSVLYVRRIDVLTALYPQSRNVYTQSNLIVTP